MNASLEFDGRPATFDAMIGLATDADGDALVNGETLTVCAWHEGQKKLTDLLKSAGYAVSHGMCEACEVGFLKQVVP